MALSWNEIKKKSIEFQKKWEGTVKERAETQTFYNEFFDVFGISRKRVASFEEPVKKLDNKQGFIDLFWKGMLLVEQKSAGRNLAKAKEQAYDYFPNLKENELPKYILVSDFNNFELYDLEENKEFKFQLKDFHKNVEHFGFIAGYEKREYKDLAPVNIKASELMGKLYDKLKHSGYSDHDLQLFLVRILFCLFADDTGIFERDNFKYFILEKTKEDGSDTGLWLTQLFQILNTSVERRQSTMDEELSKFPYINGQLFDKNIQIPSFESDMRKALLDCCYFTWSNISPAIFGSLFQSVADSVKRRSLGEHYTTEKNILKTISPLFLDDLKEEFNNILNKKNQRIALLENFQKKLASLKFFDPACGCGNFLVLAYREMRKLEIEVLKEIHKNNDQLKLDAASLSIIDVDNFYGIEIDEFPAKIAEVALWLMDHQMNLELSQTFGQYYARIPLKKSAKIIHGNALTIDWKEIISPNELSYILGNPPFIGARMKSKEQAIEMENIFAKIKGWGELDYVSAWYKKASQFIQGTKIKVGFVSTNSIVQGTQVGILWNDLLNNLGIKIHFAHRTFSWDSEASGKAHVHVVIIGFANFDTDKKRIFDYENIKGEAHEILVKNINPYLIDADDIVIQARSKSICDVPQISFGNMPNDGGNFLFTNEEYQEFIKKEPDTKKYIKPFISGYEFLNGKTRWCLWLKDITPNELKNLPLTLERVKKVKEIRLNSKREATNELAKTPNLFGFISQPNTDYILIPRVSSERRKYIPIGFFNEDNIVSDTCLFIPDATLYHFGVLTSIMHMTWMKYVCGRLESRYRYSNNIVYNNFPWPENISDMLKKRVEEKAKIVLDVRLKYPDSSLADLYDPNTMPADLVKAHNDLDKAVDTCYGKKVFETETVRIAFLFKLYENYIEK